MIWFMRYTVASDPAWNTCGTMRGWEKLGPLASLRLSILWFTGHSDDFFITEGPMLSKKWRLDVMTSDGILLQPAAKDVWPMHRRAMRLLVRPHEPAPLVNVEIGKVQNYKVPVICTSMAGNTLLEKDLPYGSTWFDITTALGTPLSKKMLNVKLLCGDKYVGRSFFHHDLTKPVPDEKVELDMMDVDHFASSTWQLKEDKEKKQLKEDKEKKQLKEDKEKKNTCRPGESKAAVKKGSLKKKNHK